MLIAKLTTPIEVADYRSLFPNVGFTQAGPDDDFLAANNAMRVNLFKPHSETQKLVPAEPYVEGDWVYTVTVVDKTAEDFAADREAKAASLMAQVQRELNRSDWYVIRAMETQTAVPQDWATYRAALRALNDDPAWPDVALPVSPDAPVTP